jgi:hypothetical protein
MILKIEMVILLLLLVEVPFRLVTQQYGKGIVSGSKSLTDTGVCYLGLDITHPVGNAGVASYDGYGASANCICIHFTAAWANYATLELETEMGEVSSNYEVVVSVEERNYVLLGSRACSRR